jgi:hypothetical protein
MKSTEESDVTIDGKPRRALARRSDGKVIRHLWHRPSCKARFESFPRFPKNAKSVRDVMTGVDVFPPLNGT